MDTNNKKTKMGNKALPYIMIIIVFLFIVGGVGTYFMYLLPQEKADIIALEQRKLDITKQEKADNLALEQRKLDIAEKEKADNLALEKEKHNSALVVEKEKNQQELQIQQAELNRELEADCQKQISDLRLRFNNVEGGGYNTISSKCEVNYAPQDGTVVYGVPANDLVSVPPIKEAYINVNILEDDGSYPDNQQSLSYRYIEPVEFKGTVATNCNKIIVIATNPNDNVYYKWQLTSYKPGDPTFKYHAKHSTGNLGQGNNRYEFTAYCEGGQEVHKTLNVYFGGPGW